MRKEYRKLGDLGDVAEKKFMNNNFFGIKKKGLTVQHVYKEILKFSQLTGNGSQTQRKNNVRKLFLGCKDKIELKFLVRILINNIRIGASVTSILYGLARAVILIKNNRNIAKSEIHFAKAEARLRKSYEICPDVLYLSKIVL
eukprot:UN29955